jgi:hypothetical protein
MHLLISGDFLNTFLCRWHQPNQFSRVRPCFESRTGLVRAGVPDTVAMAISGHKTRAVFERYNITSERDIDEAARKIEDYMDALSKRLV